MSEKALIWDVDDVLCSTTLDWFLWYRLNHRNINLKYEDLKQNPPHELLNITKEDYLESLDEFRLKYYSKLTPNQEILEWFKANGNKANHIILTAVPLNYANISAEWCTRHFGKWIRSYNFIPSKRENVEAFEYFKTKADWIKWFGKCNIFIEDNEKNLLQSREKNYKVNCYCIKQPWNFGIEVKQLLQFLDKEIEIYENYDWMGSQED